jgi:hypothetical protein
MQAGRIASVNIAKRTGTPARVALMVAAVAALAAAAGCLHENPAAPKSSGGAKTVARRGEEFLMVTQTASSDKQVVVIGPALITHVRVAHADPATAYFFLADGPAPNAQVAEQKCREVPDDDIKQGAQFAAGSDQAVSLMVEAGMVASRPPGRG